MPYTMLLDWWWAYALFAFVTNLWREQVKDLEDFEGDAACGCHTLPVLRGLGYAQKPAAVTGISVAALIVILLYFWFETNASNLQLAAGVVFLLLPALAGKHWIALRQIEKTFFLRQFAHQMDHAGRPGFVNQAHSINI